ncbi:hypothetical protein A176_003156 [Myxococcus hansupus]|uniref:Uncharacterized protein n=1 Tax=Pseudomyxococcus hansupus TaxID=1297742 RepID=A0A0H4WTW4_9BACT|nr:hypothetical protein A176_003156 [Myxococcus hansupus]
MPAGHHSPRVRFHTRYAAPAQRRRALILTPVPSEFGR